MPKIYEKTLKQCDISTFTPAYYEKVLLNLKLKVILRKNGCWSVRTRSSMMVVEGIGATLTQWVCLLKYKIIKTGYMRLISATCHSSNCINPDHVVLPEYESDDETIEDSLGMCESKILKYTLHHFDLKILDKAYEWFKAKLDIKSNGCWIARPTNLYMPLKFKLYSGNLSQWCCLFKYKKIDKQTRLNHVVCKNNRCFNPDHIIVKEFESSASLASLGLCGYKGYEDSFAFHESAPYQSIPVITPQIEQQIPPKEQLMSAQEVHHPKADGYHNESLAQAVYALNNAASTMLDQLDNCSEDIKKLEEFLESSSLATPYYFDIALKVKAKDDLYDLVQLNWEPHNEGKFRLMLHFKVNGASDIHKRPLLQMPAMVRLKGSSFMASLVEHIVANY